LRAEADVAPALAAARTGAAITEELMAEPAERQRTVLRAPRVEFDLSALALGALGWFAYQWSWPALASLLSVPSATLTSGDAPAATVAGPQVLRWEFFHRAFAALGLPYTDALEGIVSIPGTVVASKDGKGAVYSLAQSLHADVAVWKLVVVGAWLLVLWSIVAGAISRVYAVRIARDESIAAGDGLAFSVANIKSFLCAPLFALAAAGLVLGLAAAAGAASAVPGAGPFLQLVAHPLAFLAGLVAIFVVVGGVFGFPIMTAAVATERNGFLDAVSRTYSYVFTRPVAYLAAALSTLFVASIVFLLGMTFIALTTRAMAFGAQWNAAAWNPDATRIEDLGAMRLGYQAAVSPGGVLGWPNVEHVAGLAALTAYVTWALTALATIVVNGYVLAYFVGGLTDTYFMLRRDVDGIDDAEVYVDEPAPTLGDPIPGEPTAPRARP
jgi:hypothetical protein